MKIIEIKNRIDYRLKPLLAKGVRVFYKKQEFSIVEYDYFDSVGKYIIHVSDRVDPLEFDLDEIKVFIDDLRRKDGIPVPGFDDDDTKVSGKKPQKHQEARCDVNANNVAAGVNRQAASSQVVKNTVPVNATSKSFVHIESPVKVYVTKDYSLFGIVQGNRGLNKTKIKKIKDDIATGTNLLKECPIIVVEKDSKLKVIDGQHRLEVCKQIGSYVWYIVREDISLYQIATMNSNTEKWSGKDFINCYAQTGNQHYQTLKEFVSTYNFPLSISLELLAKGMEVTGGGQLMNLFREGKFRVKHEQDALTVAQQVGRFSDFSGHKGRDFVIAICKILIAGKIGIDEVVSAFEANKDKLLPQKGNKEYLINLETIVNVGKKHRRVLY